MAGRMNVIHIQLATGEPREGVWCMLCLLPSAVAVDLYQLCEHHGPHRVATVQLCRDCGDWTRTKPADGGSQP